MTDSYLRSLGFAPANQEPGARLAFDRVWRYEHEHAAQDGAHLYIEHPLGVDSCRLSNLAAPLAAQDVFATVGLHDGPALELAVKEFYAAHGGVGPRIAAFVPNRYLPYRRER